MLPYGCEPQGYSSIEYALDCDVGRAWPWNDLHCVARA